MCFCATATIRTSDQVDDRASYSQLVPGVCVVPIDSIVGERIDESPASAARRGHPYPPRILLLGDQGPYEVSNNVLNPPQRDSSE